MTNSRLLLLLLAASSRAFAIPIFFNGWGAGQMGLVSTTPTTNVNGNFTTPGNINDAVIGVGAGVNLALAGGTVTGAIDFADAANKSTSGSCPSDPGGVCRVNANSVFTGGTVTGVTLTYTNAVNNAVNEWNALISASAWGSTTNSLAVNLGSGGGTYTLCAGNGQSGCTAGMTNTTTVTHTINGVVQTAYVFNITGTSGGIVNQNIVIKGDGTTPVVLVYTGATTLSIAKSVTLTGLTSDQVLLNVTGTGGITTATGFNFAGSLAVASTTEVLTGSVIGGRVFLGGSGTATLNSGFSLTAPADTATPEPATDVMIGSALLLLGMAARKARRTARQRQ